MIVGMQLGRGGVRAQAALRMRHLTRQTKFGLQSRQEANMPRCFGTAPVTKIIDDLNNYKGRNYAFKCPVELRFVDMDVMGHVNNAVYFTMFETARLKQMQDLGVPVESPSPSTPIQPILASTSCRFKAPIMYQDPVQVGVHIEPVDDTSYEQHFAVFNEKTQRVVAEGHALVVFMNYTTGTRTSVPEKFLRGALEMQQE
jgi:acyl-CoA thioester hydrolase